MYNLLNYILESLLKKADSITAGGRNDRLYLKTWDVLTHHTSTMKTPVSARARRPRRTRFIDRHSDESLKGVAAAAAATSIILNTPSDRIIELRKKHNHAQNRNNGITAPAKTRIARTPSQGVAVNEASTAMESRQKKLRALPYSRRDAHAVTTDDNTDTLIAQRIIT